MLEESEAMARKKSKTRQRGHRDQNQEGEEQGSKSLFSLLSEPISPTSLNVYLTFSPSSLLFPPISPSSLFCSSPLNQTLVTLSLLLGCILKTKFQF